MPGARKFDMGQTAMPTLLPGSIIALEQIKKWGIDNISKTCLLYTSDAADE